MKFKYRFLRANSQNTVPLSEDMPKTQYHDLGFVGWGGIGGSVLQASPKLTKKAS